MKILIIGGNGTIGKKVSDHFSKKHEVLIGGRTSGDIKVDIADSKSIQAMFETIGNLDAVVVIEKPKLSPFIQKIRESIASILESNVDQISVKATTNEKLGFIGREEGIAAIASLLVVRTD